jgi:hypothetical protein
MVDLNSSEADGFITEKLYSPLEFYLHNWREEEERGEYGVKGFYDAEYEISHGIAFEHMDAIELAIRRDRERFHSETGLAEHVPDSLKGAVVSVVPNIELHGNDLWCATDIKLSRPLAVEEMVALKDWWRGQLSDGWGEGFEHRAIQSGRDELFVVPWSPDEAFFIDFSFEFKRRLGLDAPSAKRSAAEQETPAQAALHEPDIFDDTRTAGLREQLIERLNSNFSDFISSYADRYESEIPEASSVIAATADAHFYLTYTHNFHASELEYLLRFRDPLQVVADAFGNEDLIEHSDTMWDVFHKQFALEGGYEFVADPSAPSLDDMVAQLRGRLAENYEVFKRDMLDTGKENIFYSAAEILPVQEAYSYFAHEHNYLESDVAFLLKFQNPLELVSDRWSDRRGVTEMVDAIFKNQERTISQGGYALAADEPEPARSVVETPEKSAAAVEKPSVLAQLREARNAPKEPRRDNPQKDRGGPEL